MAPANADDQAFFYALMMMAAARNGNTPAATMKRRLALRPIIATRDRAVLGDGKKYLANDEAIYHSAMK